MVGDATAEPAAPVFVLVVDDEALAAELADRLVPLRLQFASSLLEALPLVRQLAPYVVIAGGPDQVALAVALRGAAGEVDAIVMRANEIGVGEISVSVICYLIGQVRQRRREAASH